VADARALNPLSGRGRQAEARRNDLAVLDAARDVFTAHGAGAPITAVAERAGVGMGTLYRRYGSKTELLQRLCVLAMEQALDAAADALQADDPWAGLAGYIRACVDLRSGALASLAGQIETTDEMRATAQRGLASTADIVARAHHDGRLRADVTALDINWLIEQFSRRAPDPVDPDEERNVRSRLLAIALDGLRARADGQALPGQPPSAEHYANRWSATAQQLSVVTTCPPASWTAAHLADEQISGNAVLNPPLLRILKANWVGQFRHRLIGCLGEPCLSQQVNYFLPAVLHHDTLLAQERLRLALDRLRVPTRGHGEGPNHPQRE
jgi:AcrR family transcriptional regulator